MNTMQHRTPRILLSALALAALAAMLTFSAVASAHGPHGTGTPQFAKGGHHGHLGFGVLKPKGGTTVLTVDPAALTALTAAGVTPTPFGTATASGAAFTFPITGGSVVFKHRNHGRGHGAGRKPLAGSIRHEGSGLTLTKGTTVVTLSDLRVNLAAGRFGRIDAKVSTGGRLKLAFLSNVVVDATAHTATATATLTPAAIAAANSTFGTTLPANAVLGTLVITPTF